MNSSFNFADKKRGLWATTEGKLYITKPGTKDIIKPPLTFTPPFRIIVSDQFDPFAIIIPSNGYIFLLNIEEQKVVMKEKLPANAGVIEFIQFEKEKSLIILHSNHGTFIHSILDNTENLNNHWNMVDEPLECLETNPDSKSFAQCSRLEGLIANALNNIDFENYAESVKKYLLYTATYLPNPAFIAAWYELINASTPFEEADMNALWSDAILLLSSVERVSSLIDELEMSLSRK